MIGAHPGIDPCPLVQESDALHFNHLATRSDIALNKLTLYIGHTIRVLPYSYSHTWYKLDNCVCYMTGENTVSLLAQLVFINLYVYLETGLNWSTS